MSDNGKPVVVTTKYRGVFFGYVEERDSDARKIRLRHARNCVYWESSVKGFVGLAANGPSDGCRVGPRSPDDMDLYGVTSVTAASPEAVEKWEKGPWK